MSIKYGFQRTSGAKKFLDFTSLGSTRVRDSADEDVLYDTQEAAALTLTKHLSAGGDPWTFGGPFVLVKVEQTAGKKGWVLKTGCGNFANLDKYPLPHYFRTVEEAKVYFSQTAALQHLTELSSARRWIFSSIAEVAEIDIPGTLTITPA